MGVCSFSCIGGIIIYTKKDIKKFLSIFYDLESLSHKGVQEALCIYIDIKAALKILPVEYRRLVEARFIYQDKTTPLGQANKGIKLMEDFLNGR